VPLRLFVVLPLALLISGCSHATQQSTPTPDEVLTSPEGHRIITQIAIEHSGARTAWEALERTVPFFSFRDNNRGKPTRIEHRGRSSIVLRDQPLILVDGVELNDFTSLGGMPAADIFEIEVLSGIDATTYYGTGASKGVIRIWTKGSRS
jgi:outer membrane cobalamin receptor